MKCHWCGGTGYRGGCSCEHCCNGLMTDPPYFDGSLCRMADKLVSEFATSVTLLRCIGTEQMIQSIAQYAARVELPKEAVDKFIAYWGDLYRDANLGEYIRQIAQYSEYWGDTHFSPDDQPYLLVPRALIE